MPYVVGPDYEGVLNPFMGLSGAGVVGGGDFDPRAALAAQAAAAPPPAAAPPMNVVDPQAAAAARLSSITDSPAGVGINSGDPAMALARERQTADPWAIAKDLNIAPRSFVDPSTMTRSGYSVGEMFPAGIQAQSGRYAPFLTTGAGGLPERFIPFPAGNTNFQPFGTASIGTESGLGPAARGGDTSNIGGGVPNTGGTAISPGEVVSGAFSTSMGPQAAVNQSGEIGPAMGIGFNASEGLTGPIDANSGLLGGFQGMSPVSASSGLVSHADSQAPGPIGGFTVSADGVVSDANGSPVGVIGGSPAAAALGIGGGDSSGLGGGGFGDGGLGGFGGDSSSNAGLGGPAGTGVAGGIGAAAGAGAGTGGVGEGEQFGGAFTVGGQGGPDNQMVSFKATPGEQVRVVPPGTNPFAQLPMPTTRQVQVEPGGLRPPSTALPGTSNFPQGVPPPPPGGIPPGTGAAGLPPGMARRTTNISGTPAPLTPPGLNRTTGMPTPGGAPPPGGTGIPPLPPLGPGGGTAPFGAPGVNPQVLAQLRALLSGMGPF